MMSNDELQAWYPRLERVSPPYHEVQAFLDALVERHDPERLKFHFGLLRNQDNFPLYAEIRSAFKDHGPVAEPFLVETFRTEDDPELRADALQLLGHMRSKDAYAIAKEAAKDEHETVRYRGVIVLGWVGTADDMKTVLRDRVRNDRSAFVRGNAATAYRQIGYRIPGTAELAIEVLGEALRTEEDEEVICSIVVSLQTIMKRRFGIREPDDGPDFVGDSKLAKQRAIRALDRRQTGS